MLNKKANMATNVLFALLIVVLIVVLITGCFAIWVYVDATDQFSEDKKSCYEESSNCEYYGCLIEKDYSYQEEYIDCKAGVKA